MDNILTADHHQYGVHDNHCCKHHGCKYGDPRCPVEFGSADGVECESCYEDEQEVAAQRPFLLYEYIPGYAPQLVAVIDTQGFNDKDMSEVIDMLDTIKHHRNMTAHSGLPTYTLRPAPGLKMISSGMSMSQVLEKFLSKTS